MSLRTFHIFFMLTVLGLMVYMAYWAGHHLAHGADGINVILAVSAALGLALGVPYLGWFIKKTKTL